MKYILFLFITSGMFAQKQDAIFITEDITNFWKAYDKITATNDSVAQYNYINNLYIKKGTPGLTAIMASRSYTPKSYIEAIRKYPKFWNSVRKNTSGVKKHIPAIHKNIEKLISICPGLMHSKFYYTIGALRTGGTVSDNKVLIGTELSLADKNTVTAEFEYPINENRRSYFDSYSDEGFVLLNVHEYIHTQQNEAVYDLLSICLYEGVAEYISSLITGIPSQIPAFAVGRQNHAKVMANFEIDMFSRYKQGYWLWSDTPNEFNIRDLGYYVGYVLCESYYTNAKDKNTAIKELIQLDYHDEKAIEKLVNDTHLFAAPLETLKMRFEANRPKSTGIKEFENGSQNVDPSITTITIQFSRKMNTYYKSTDLGELGKEHFPQVTSIVFAPDGMSVTYNLKLEPNKHYQMVLESGYRSDDLHQLIPYAITFKTAAQ